MLPGQQFELMIHTTPSIVEEERGYLPFTAPSSSRRSLREHILTVNVITFGDQIVSAAKIRVIK